jgi:hypothetical protein
MTLQQQTEWVSNQLKYSKMLEDGDSEKWHAVHTSLAELHGCLNYIGSLRNQSFEGWSEEAQKGYLTALQSLEHKLTR